MRAAFDHGYPVKLEKIDKFADGIAVQKVGAKTYEVARKYVDRLLGVDEGLISETLIDMYSKVGTIAEPAGAASVAALEVIKDEIKGKLSFASFQAVIMISTVCQRWKNVPLSMMGSSTILWLISHNVQEPFVSL